MASKPMMGKHVQVKVFSTVSANTLEKAINEWRVTLSDNIELFNVKYSIATRAVDSNWDIYSALIVYGEGSELF